MARKLNRSAKKGIARDAQRHFRGARGGHGWDHTERVLMLALHMGRIEGADLDVIGLGALLHDVGRHREDRSAGAICHAEEGAVIARKILRRHGVEGPLAERVVHCIRGHRFRGSNRPETREARILFDADKLDAIGAVGIGRAFLFAGEHGAKLHNSAGVDPARAAAYGPEDTAYREFLVKLRHLHRRMLTREGRRLARERHAFMRLFFKRLGAELGGCLLYNLVEPLYWGHDIS